METHKASMKDFFSYVSDIRKIPGESLEQISEYVRGNYSLLDRLLKATPTLEMFYKAERNAWKMGWGYACMEALKETGIDYEVRGEEKIPESGSVVCPSNHPYGILDGMLFGAALVPAFEKMQRKLRILATPQLGIIKGIEKLVSFVNPSEKGHYQHSLREPIKHLRDNGDLAMYPAGRVSGPGLREYSWKTGLGFLALETEAVLPMWISGPNHGRVYNILAGNKLTERFRSLFLMRETWNKKGKKFILKIGEPIPKETIQKIGDKKEITLHIRKKCEELKLAV